MKILIVGGDDPLLSSLTEELESRDFEVLPTHFGEGGLDLYKKHGPFTIVLADYRFIPGVTIKDCIQLVTAIHRINPFQGMAMMTSDAKDARRNLPLALQHIPVLRTPFKVEHVLRLLRQPMLPF
jgi:CheY-like chemotaxis protein